MSDPGAQIENLRDRIEESDDISEDARQFREALSRS